MPKFSISCWVNNKGTATVSAHVGASLVNAIDGTEYFNTADDIKKTLIQEKPGYSGISTQNSAPLECMIFTSLYGKVKKRLEQV